MKELSEFLREDATYAKLEKEGDELSALVLESLHNATAKGAAPISDVAAEAEKYRSYNDQMALNASKIELAKASLLPKYNEAIALETGMQATNALNSGGQKQQARTPLDFLMESKEYAALPNFHDSDGYAIPGMKKWDSPEARGQKILAVKIPGRSLNPASVLRRNGGMMATDANAISTSSMAPYYQGLDGTTPYALWSSDLLDILPTIQLTSNNIKWRKQTTLTRNDASVAETVAPSQSTFATTLGSATAQAIEGFYKISEEELMMQVDALAFTAFECQRDLRVKAAQKILSGAGPEGTDFVGIYGQAATNLAKTACPIDANGNVAGDLECLGYTIQKIRTQGVCRPNLGIMNPNQVMPIYLLRDVMGEPVNRPAYGLTIDPFGGMSFMGVKFIQEAYAVDGSVLIGDFSAFYQLALMQNLTIELGYDGNDWTNRERTMRFWLYGCNVVRRTSAFGAATGLTSQGMTIPS